MRRKFSRPSGNWPYPSAYMTKRTMSATGSPLGHCPSHWPHMRQKYGPISSRRADKILASASVKCSDMAWKFCSSWSISVMLGTVVAIARIVDGPLERGGGEIGGPLRLSAPASAVSRPGHHLHGDHAHAGLVQLLDSRAVARSRSEVVLHLHHFEFGFDDPVDDRRQIVRAHADEPDLALLLGLALRFDQLIGNLRRVA